MDVPRHVKKVIEGIRQQSIQRYVEARRGGDGKYGGKEEGSVIPLVFCNVYKLRDCKGEIDIACDANLQIGERFGVCQSVT